MVVKRRRKNRLVIAAFLFLSMISLLLVVVSVLFFTSPVVQMQFQEWAQSLLSGEYSTQYIQPKRSGSAYRGEAILAKPQPGSRAKEAPRSMQQDQLDVSLAAQSHAPEPSQQPAARRQASSNPSLGEKGLEWIPDPEQATNKTAALSYPQGKIFIPALGIDSPVDRVPVQQGDWDLSKLDSGIGWLEMTGTYPGDNLAMVFLAHVTMPYGGPGPFVNLYTLSPGEMLYYRTAEAVYVYEIGYQEVIRPDAVDTVYVHDGKKLLLITCTSWNVVKQKYDRRLVVVATLVQTYHQLASP